MKTLTQSESVTCLRAAPALWDRGWWTIVWLTLSGIALGILSLLYAIGSYELAVFQSYFHHPLILFLNVAPVVLLNFFFYFLYGRTHRAFLTTACIVIGLSFADYYMLRLRDDPLMFADLLSAKEGISISFKQGYDLTPDRRMLFGIACIVLGFLFLKFLCRARLGGRFRRRVWLALIPAVLCVPLTLTMLNSTVYTAYAVNNDQTNQWAATQVYLSKGFVYPFIHSSTSDTLKKPKGYHASDAKKLLSQYEDAAIPEESKVSVVTVQLEAFADFSDCGAQGVDWDSAYAAYDSILAESYHGTLLTNIFAGGTVNTERCFLTGFAQLKNFRSATNSYARYFASQGYAVTGSHPSYAWFYNRENVNSYLGFPEYRFYENYYSDLADGQIAMDDVLLPEIHSQWDAVSADGTPVFSFNVTYQGHGPYSATEVWRDQHYTDNRYSTASTNILDNYLGSVQNTAEQLRAMLDTFADSDKPVVVVLYGDHKPWLGDNSSVYAELGISLDTSTEEGLFNKYATDYIIWANDAAKAATGHDFTGNGPTLSSNYLMNEVFDQCGWTGNAYMQATEDIRQTLPIITTIGRYAEGDSIGTRDDLTADGTEALQRFELLQYYWQKNFAG
ncbi:MAG: LTA synthase family protein [Oscillibacter sp.]|nr:LTA synthase family protein [Oscillibacter sp.]